MRNCICLISFSSYSESFVESRQFSLPRLHLASPFGMTLFEFSKIFDIRKLRVIGYRVALFA